MDKETTSPSIMTTSSTTTKVPKASSSSSTTTSIKMSAMPLLKGNIGARRMYIGHFQGSKTPNFRNSKLISLREESLKTQLERIEHNTDLKKTIKEEMIRRVKFNEANRHLQGQDFQFQFVELLDNNNTTTTTTTTNNNNTDVGLTTTTTTAEMTKKTKSKNKNNSNNNNNEEQKRIFLGKPTVSKDTHNYAYCVIEVQEKNDPNTSTGRNKVAYVYPADMVEFGLESLMVSNAEMTSDKLEKDYRRRCRKWQKKQIGEFKTLSKLFGHDRLATQENRALSEADGGGGGGKSRIRYRGNEINEDVEEIIIKQLQVGSISTSNITGIDEKKDEHLREKFKKYKIRGNLEELPDYNEIISDDEDETNLGDVDLVDDHEKDEWTDEDVEESSSEEDEKYIKLKKLQNEDVENKDFEVPVKKEGDKNGDEENENEEKDEEALWSISDDEEEEDVKNETKKTQLPGKRKRKSEGGEDEGGGEEEEETATGDATKQRPAKRRRLNDGTPQLQMNLSEKKEDSKLMNLREDVVSILTKYGKVGINTHDLWEKLRAIHSTEKEKFKEELAKILKEVGSRKPNSSLWYLKNK